MAQALTGENVPVAEYVRGDFKIVSHLAHGWEMHSAVLLSPSEERMAVREPVQAVPNSLAKRLGALRALLVPYIACLDSGDVVCFSKLRGQTHTAAWFETETRTNIILACRELDPHDTGFEFLASIAELARPRLTAEEVEQYSQLVRSELEQDIPGEMDKETLAAKQSLLTKRTSWRHEPEKFDQYRDLSLAGTLAEYMHGLWHDVQIQTGPEHLPLPQLRQRLQWMAKTFPPNPGYEVFSKEIEQLG
ncbi:MAG TPA: hypothetical protein VMX16_13760 [Terriglobia bacterium]|nr:hypothetical protein [Terriglobia bacterium]